MYNIENITEVDQLITEAKASREEIKILLNNFTEFLNSLVNKWEKEFNKIKPTIELRVFDTSLRWRRNSPIESFILEAVASCCLKDSVEISWINYGLEINYPLKNAEKRIEDAFVKWLDDNAKVLIHNENEVKR